jgi:hypothetical protein
VTWVLLAVLGLVVAIAVGVAASELTSRRIGLSSEPIRAGDALAPPPERYPGGGRHHGGDGSRPGGDDGAPAPPGGTTSTPDDSTRAPDDSTSAPEDSAAPTGPGTNDSDGDTDDD